MSAITNPLLVQIQKDAQDILATLPNAQNVYDQDSAVIAGLNSQLVIANARMPHTYFSLEKYGLFAADKKIPFQWIQPGNTGNTGGGSNLAHGSETWTITPNGTIMAVSPKNIAPRSDNFDNYMVLPFPEVPPKRQRAWADNYSCQTPAD